MRASLLGNARASVGDFDYHHGAFAPPGDAELIAARVARVAERTLRRWQNVPAFQSELARQRARLLDGACTALVRGAHAAAAALVAMAGGESPATAARIAAARAVIDLALRGQELGDVVRRLEALEVGTTGGDVHSPSQEGLP